MWFLLLTCAAAATCDESSLLQQVPGGLHIDLVVPPVPSKHEQSYAAMVKQSPKEKAAERMAEKAAKKEQARCSLYATYAFKETNVFRCTLTI